ncbi:sulfite exporter TauE/SafE family protein [Oceaniglobus ichthyenteri]|uniref:sulfite exporter TauE/SafE family protein n=1 Tax=Oceaniglobus ichthyenteri TaxID=2136177 RepID=UPI000D3AB1A8|nr:sulfite exporter TauE/SafE family protein [Oceaniglobus ichthyenteri]
MIELLILCLASFGAGALNAVAGGGTFLTFPALVWTGIPTVSANATATLVVLPGYIASAWAFRHNIRQQGSLALRSVIIISVFAGLLGALLLIQTSDQAFSGIVPWLLLISTVLFAIGPAFTRYLSRRGVAPAGPIISAVALICVSIYGGYFNGGLGIILLATFGLLGFTDLHAMNGLKNVLSAILSLTSAIAFILAGLIVWKVAIPMALAATAGGYFGAYTSRRIKNTNILRWFVVFVGAVMTVLFFAG